MENERIVVLLKYYKGELNPFDGAALECALQSGAKEIIALTMSPLSVLESLKSLTRLGVKGILVSDISFAGSDTQATSLVLARAIERLNPDLVFCGRQSVDGDTAQVPPMIAKRLGFDIKVKAMQFDKGKVIFRNGESFYLKDKTVITFEKIKTLRFPSIFSKQGEVEIWDNSVIGLLENECGQQGSPTRVIKSYESTVGRRFCKFTDKENLAELIEQGLKKQREEQSQTVGEKLKEVYYVGDIKKVALSIAEKAIELQTDGKTEQDLVKEIKSKNIKTVLFEEGDANKILASKLAVITGAGICADCILFRVQNGKLIMTRPALGGNVTADIECRSEITFATVRTAKNNGAKVIFSVGRGAMDYIEQVKVLAEKFGGEICCSRVVADSGKLPYEMQVGLTGKTVSPKVYVAIGISGAVQHTSAISGAQTIIAINNDKDARIFDYSDYGIVTDIKNIIS